MSIRKTGAVTGQVTEVDGPQEGITATASAVPGQLPLWSEGDELALGEENEAADQG
jgi:hypothetical protein